MNIEKLELKVANSDHITNAYLAYDENKHGILIDPADEASIIIDKINELKLKIEYIVLTHAHFDHINALYDVKKYLLNAKVLIHIDDFDMLIGNVDNASSMFSAKNKFIPRKEITTINDGFCLNVGNLEFEFMHTPGHTSGSSILFEKNSNIIFSGDTIFSNSYGRCDLATGNFENLVNSLRKIFNKYGDSDITVYPGHGDSSNLRKIKKYITLLLAFKKIKL